MTTPHQERTGVFISYSHRDREWLNRLRVHLKPLERQYNVEIWDDTRIVGGSKWREEIDKTLASAKVAVLLVSADFLASDFIVMNELPRLLKAAEDSGAVILPVILSPSRYSHITHISQFEAINDPAAPLVSLTKAAQEETLVQVTAAIESALGLAPDVNSAQPRQQTTNVSSGQTRHQSTSEIGRNRTRQTKFLRSLKIHPTIWVAIITGVATLVAAYWQFIEKPSRLVKAQSFQYTGRVTDGVSNKPIHNAQISIEEDQKVPQIRSTDSSGIFSVWFKETPRAVRIRVEADDYNVFERNISLSTTGVDDIRLMPAQPSDNQRQVSGNWEITTYLPGETPNKGSLNLTQIGKVVSGFIEDSAEGKVNISEVVLDGDLITFNLVRGEVSFAFSGTVSQSTMSGTVSVKKGDRAAVTNFKWLAARH